jgi:predicted aconitase/predicted aconitase with swiveling domain
MGCQFDPASNLFQVRPSRETPVVSQLLSRFVLVGSAEGPVVATSEGLSFWGGVDSATARVIDTHHPLRGVLLSGAVLLMPTSRGSCSGSGTLLDMALNDRAPAALVFRDEEDVLTLGARIAAEMFSKVIPVVRLDAGAFVALSRASSARIADGVIVAEGLRLPLAAATDRAPELTAADAAMLAGAEGEAAQLAMRIVVAVAAQQGAERLVDVAQAHIDGCIYASPANLVFAQRMAGLGARVRIPTTTNAISVDRENWRGQGVPTGFGEAAAGLADAYVRMGCQPSFTCAPYLLDSAPLAGTVVAWAESNAVLFANSVLGARTAKHPDFLDLCIALTGRAPLAGVYLDEPRKARRILDVEALADADDAFWPLVGYLAGKASPDRIPMLRGLSGMTPSRDDLKALCAAFGTTSAAPMLHIEGVTPDAVAAGDADHARLTRADLAAAWTALNDGPAEVDLVAFGSPHASLTECRALADLFEGRRVHDGVVAMVTAGRDVIARARAEGLLDRLAQSGVRVLPDLCWCSISEPVFPPQARVVLTNSGKYAHYGPGLSGRRVRFGALEDCLRAACGKAAPARLPDWLGG